jgi:hypothetical protein
MHWFLSEIPLRMMDVPELPAAILAKNKVKPGWLIPQASWLK